MRYIYCLSSIFIFLVISGMQEQRKEKVLFFGDSITQAGIKPGGYISLLKESLPEKELIGAGIGGNKVYDLFLRLEDDVLSKKPDIVFIYIGVNDVWHKQSSLTGTDPDKFAAFYSAIINKLKKNGIKTILCTPAVIGERTDFSNSQDGDLNRYSQIIRDLASKHGCGLVDLRKAFLEYNLKNNPENKESGILTTDRVHLNQAGNQLLADLMQKALEGK